GGGGGGRGGYGGGGGDGGGGGYGGGGGGGGGGEGLWMGGRGTRGARGVLPRGERVGGVLSPPGGGFFAGGGGGLWLGCGNSGCCPCAREVGRVPNNGRSGRTVCSLPRYGFENPTFISRREWGEVGPVVKLRVRSGESIQEAVRRFRKLCERSGLRKEMRRKA